MRTGFTVPFGHYEFNKLPFGLSNSLANFQRLMDKVLNDLIVSELFVFIDDLFSKSAEEHAIRLEHMLERLEKAHLQLHSGKCIFAQPRVSYLGFELSESGVSAYVDKGKTFQEYPTLKNVKVVRALLGLAYFYRNLVPNIAEIAKPLTHY